jgi:hypothetical protein
MAEKDWTTLVIETLIKDLNQTISVAYIGEITELTPPTASLQPLEIIAGKKQNIVSRAKFVFSPIIDKDNNPLKIHYKVGDSVLAVVLDNDPMYFTGAGTFKVDSTRNHAPDFSFVVGKYAEASDFA